MELCNETSSRTEKKGAPTNPMSRRKDIAQAAVQAQMQSLIAVLQLYQEEFSKTPQDREKLQELVERAEALRARYNELTAPRTPAR